MTCIMAKASAASVPGGWRSGGPKAYSAVLVRIDGVELRTIAAGLNDERPEMHVGAEDVGAPGDDQFGMAELLGLDGMAHAQRVAQTRYTGGGADGAVEPRCAQAVEKTAIHARAVSRPMVPA